MSKFWQGWKQNQRVRIRDPNEIAGAELLAKHWEPNMALVEVPGSHLYLTTITKPNKKFDAYLMELTGEKMKKIGKNLTIDQLIEAIKTIWTSNPPMML